MPTRRGQAAVNRFFEQLPEQIEAKLLLGAGRAAGEVIASRARELSVSNEVADAIIVRARRDSGRIVVKITVKPGWAYSLGVWQEWGTEPHFIRVDESQRQGLGIGRFNELHRTGSLVINGRFVGDTVFHPGAQAHPFLRVALDLEEDAWVAAAQGFINSRVTPAGIVGTADRDEDGA